MVQHTRAQATPTLHSWLIHSEVSIKRLCKPTVRPQRWRFFVEFWGKSTGIKYCQHRHSLASDAKIVGKLTGDLCDLVGHSGFHQTTDTGLFDAGVTWERVCPSECVYACLHAEMHARHMAVRCVRGRKSY